VIVTKSAVPVGTNHKLRDVVARTRPDADFDVASNPEFLREDAAIDDFMRPASYLLLPRTENIGRKA
jgi:UDPglucose 6-dehydrogenase